MEGRIHKNNSIDSKSDLLCEAQNLRIFDFINSAQLSLSYQSNFETSKKMKYTALLSLVNAQVARPGPCPDVPDHPDFNVGEYLGVWFTFMTNDFINVPRNSECVAATYGFKNDNAISVNNTEVLNIDIRSGFF